MIEDSDFKCKITNKETISDCHITIEFGYGSDLDLTTYEFSPVHESVGKEILKLIDGMIQKEYQDHPTLGVQMSNNPNIEEFARNTMDEYFGEYPKEDLSTKAEWGFDS
jgi:hypothetical protein